MPVGATVISGRGAVEIGTSAKVLGVAVRPAGSTWGVAEVTVSPKVPVEGSSSGTGKGSSTADGRVTTSGRKSGPKVDNEFCSTVALWATTGAILREDSGWAPATGRENEESNDDDVARIGGGGVKFVKSGPVIKGVGRMAVKSGAGSGGSGRVGDGCCVVAGIITGAWEV